MANLQKLFCSMAGSLVFFLGSAGAGVRVLAAEEEPAEAPEAAEAAEAETSSREEAELFESGCAFADSGDEFSFSASKTRYEMGEKIVVSIHSDPSDEVISLEHTAEGFRVSAPRETAEDQIEITLTHDIEYIEPQFTITAKTQSGEVKVRRLYGAYTECGLYVSSSSAESAWGNYCYDLYSHGTISEEEFYAARMKLFGGCVKETVSTSAPSASVYSVNATNTVNATLKWEDDSHVTHPLQYTKTEIWDVYHGALLGTVYTDVNGRFTFRFENSYVVQLRLRAFAEGENSSVTDTNGKVYALDSSIYGGITPGATTSCNLTIDMSNEFGQAFQISQAVITAARYATEMNGKPLSDVKVKYYDPNAYQDSKVDALRNENCYYDGSAKILYIVDNDETHYDLFTYSSWDVIMHEYGHHVENDLNILVGPGLSHSFSENLIDSNYYQYTKAQAINLTWKEAYANIYSGMAQAYFASSLQNIQSVGDAQHFSYNGANIDYETTTGVFYPYRKSANGEACEGAVIGVLWDLFDPANESHDFLYFGHKTMWDLIKNSKATTFSELVSYFNRIYPQNTVFALGKMLTHYGMAVSNIQCQFMGNYRRYYWMPNGTSSELPNNKFTVIFYDGVGVEIFRRDTLMDSLIIYQEDVEKIKDCTGATYSVAVIAYQTGYPETGPYYSDLTTFNKSAL